MVISHTQKGFTADHKGMQCSRSTSSNRLEQDEFVPIPLVNERVDVVFTSIVVVCKGKECLTIDLKGFHIIGSIRLKRL